MFLPLELTLRPSRVYAAVLLLAHGLALIGAWLAALQVWMQAALTLALAASLIWMRREISSSPRGLRVSHSGRLELLDGEWRGAQIRGRPVVLPWLLRLELALEDGEVRRIALLPDSAETDSLRKLRVWLKWGWPNC